jgi:adenosylhomocysteine nucleosidase
VIAIFSALDEEIREFKMGMSIEKDSSYQCCRMYQGKYRGKDCVLVVTGMGGEHARQVTQLILSTYPVSALISTGFGGSLNRKTQIGDLVIYSKLVAAPASEIHEQMPELISDPGLVAQALTVRSDKFQVLLGRGLSLSRVCSLPSDKLDLGKLFDADIVDMESFSIGQAASEKGYPFIAVRSIFDAVDDDLSLLDHIAVSGKLNPLKACSRLIAHPGDLGTLLGYSRNAVKARKNLAAFLFDLVEKIAEN